MTPITPAAATDSNSGAVICSRLIMKPPGLESTSGIVGRATREPIEKITADPQFDEA
jgi:hypothetical protein